MKREVFTGDYRFLEIPSAAMEFKYYYPMRNIESFRKIQDYQLKAQMKATISALNISSRRYDF